MLAEHLQLEGREESITSFMPIRPWFDRGRTVRVVFRETDRHLL